MALSQDYVNQLVREAAAAQLRFPRDTQWPDAPV
jgi:hypothetical protein